MADRNRDQQQNRRVPGYRRHYGGGYDEDPTRGPGNYRGAGYGRNEEEGYIQDIGREHTDMQGRRGRMITGASGSDYARAMGDIRNREIDNYSTRRSEGPYRGKGPRNYQRSQDRIREDVCDRLTDDAMIDATNVEVRVDNDAVVLNGVVHNREEKHRAEDLAESVAGVRNVMNNLRVEPGSSGTTNYYREYDEEGRIRRSSW